MRYWTFLALLLFSSTLFAQGSLEINAKVYSPHGDFKRNVDHIPAGLSFSYTRTIKNSRFYWGAELGIAMYYYDQYEYELVKEGYPGEFVEVAEEDCFWTGHLLARYLFISTENVRTYGEARMGATSFFSSRMAVEENSPFKNEFSVHGTAFNTGIGGGIMLNPRGLLSKTKPPGNLWIILGANLHSGSATNYRFAEGAQRQPLSGGKYKSLTHYTDFKLGLVIPL